MEVIGSRSLVSWLVYELLKGRKYPYIGVEITQFLSSLGHPSSLPNRSRGKVFLGFFEVHIPPQKVIGRL